APPPALPTETFLPDPDDGAPPQYSRRQDGWSAANQRRFLEAIAEGHGVESACRCVGLSATSAYAFRRTARGAAFALGWRAASLVAREAIAETLLVRALEGQVDTYVRADGSSVTRHRHDNRLALSLLARLDRQVESAPDADAKAARLVAQEFDAYLDLVTRDEGPARAGLFLARRAGQLTDDGEDAAADLAPIFALAAADRLARTGHASAADVPVADLDPAARAEWTAEQWQRAEAAGLLRLALPQTEPPEAAPEPSPEPQLSQHSPIEAPLRDDLLVWWDEGEERWYTCFPPPDDFDGDEDGSPEDMDYSRTLTDEEEEAMGRGPEHHAPATIAALARSRAPYFARIAQQRSVPQLPPLLARLLAARDGGAGASNGGSAGGSRPPPSHCPPQTASPGGE
ncbi:hypothetical protein, partial [Sphingomonas jeddahensis]|uniref:hypothetical protein n=1 Tax=Sphingomonas jeddahensis TaxID=1915074 RepID=UPI0009754392